MAIVLYSTDCPKCKILEKKLEQAEIDFQINKDVDKLIAMGIQEAPILSIDGAYHNFKSAVEWVNKKEN